ncbi:MAG: 50S ribosomal protein L4 [Candidatus Omnitrophota bacterium]
MQTLSVYNIEGKEIDTVKLDAGVFDGVVNESVIHQVVVAYLSGQRKGLAATKTRGEVSGGGRKPWKQKGTGRARIGSIRSPLWRHGGVVFGPHPRDFSSPIPQKIKKLALKSALNAKVNAGEVTVIDALSLPSSKTKEAAKVFTHLKINTKKRTKADAGKNKGVLLLMDKIDAGLRRALANISFLKFGLARDTHTYEVMSCGRLLITRESLKAVTERLKK